MFPVCTSAARISPDDARRGGWYASHGSKPRATTASMEASISSCSSADATAPRNAREASFVARRCDKVIQISNGRRNTTSRIIQPKSVLDCACCASPL